MTNTNVSSCSLVDGIPALEQKLAQVRKAQE